MKKIQFVQIFVLALLFVFCSCQNGEDSDDLIIWFDKPANQWEETLPLGNGRLGMTPDGGILKETIVLNDITLWSGSKQDANNYNAHKHLPEIRQMIIEGRNDEAQKLMNNVFVCKGEGSGHGNGANVPFGCFQMLGKLILDFKYASSDPSIKRYKRELLLNNAIATCEYQINEVKYKREYFSSFYNDLNIIRLTSETKGALNFEMHLSRPENVEINITSNKIEMFGQMNNGRDGGGMKYKVLLKPILKDGYLISGDSSLIVSNSSEVLLLLSSGTDYWDPDFETRIEAILNKASEIPYNHQKQRHISNYQHFFNRIFFRLEGPNQKEIPTDERLFLFAKQPEKDINLPVLFFQFGRYLSISSIRDGLLPPNLQGLWTNQIQTPWNGDYHLDINIQMNHWHLDVVNLSELNRPLVKLVESLEENGKKTARAYYDADGWVAHVITNIWGYTEPGEDVSWGSSICGSGWICNNLWQHYEFTRDKKYLNKIYPIIKGAADFYLDCLIKDPNTGWLVTCPSVSPENSFVLPNENYANVCMGPTIENQILRELFTNVISASRILGKDEEECKNLMEILDSIPPVGVIGEDGRLLEWLRDYPEVDPHHRHVSHLYGLFPGDQISPELTPNLADAARKTLDVRGDDGPSWSIAYKMLCRARLKEGNHAFELLKKLLRPTMNTQINYGEGGGVYPNLFSAGPPFQIDGNFGGTAAIAELLIQSHLGIIELLPALPEIWAKGGKVKGLKARGNYIVDMEWEGGKILDYTVYSFEPRNVKVKVNGKIMEIRTSRLKQRY